MYDLLIRSVTYVWETLKFLGEATIGIFAPGQPGFLLLLLAVVVALGKYGGRVLQKRKFFRSARIFTRLVQGCGALLICFAVYQMIQVVYPLAVKAISAIK